MSRKEMAARTPWWAMLTHPVAVALMWCSFGYVSVVATYSADAAIPVVFMHILQHRRCVLIILSCA
jgi:hypothetical protein